MAGDAECPRAKQRRVLKVAKFADDDDENVLKQIVGVGRPSDAGQIASQRRLDTVEQRFERFAVAALPAAPTAFLGSA